MRAADGIAASVAALARLWRCPRTRLHMQEMNNSTTPTAMPTPALAPPLPASLEELGVGAHDDGGLHGVEAVGVAEVEGKT